MSSSQNRLLVPASGATTRAAAASNPNTLSDTSSSQNIIQSTDQQIDACNQHSVDDDFDSYWEEEARNPHRNRIRIGRQYQATVPPLLKHGEKDPRKLEDLETLSFCPKKSSKVSDAELNHYFTVAKSLNIFASLVETRSLLGRDVTIADLNHIRHKEGLSLASVIQPNRQAINYANSLSSPSSSQQIISASSIQTSSSPQKSPQQSLASPKDQTSLGKLNFNLPLMRALSHFISLHHPCHHDRDCKKLLKDAPLEDDSIPTVSIPAGNLRQSSSLSKDARASSRSRTSAKQSSVKDESSEKDAEDFQASADGIQSPNYDDWTREEVELFSKAIEVCGKNFGSIKKDFLPSKSVKSIVEYYYIGSRDAPDAKKKSGQPAETSDVCSSPEKSSASNNGQGGGGGGSFIGGKTEPSSGLAHTSNTTGASANSSSRNSGSKSETENSDEKLSDQMDRATLLNHSAVSLSKVESLIKTNISLDTSSNGDPISNSNNFDARMSIYNFDEENKEDCPVRLDCPRPGAEVKPLKAKPILPGASIEGEAPNSNVGSLKFFMDGQLVLKLNARQEQQEGIEKCHWVQSGDKVINTTKQKRYMKRGDKSSNSRQNGSQGDDASYFNEDEFKDNASMDEDSKESTINSSSPSTPQQKTNSPHPKSKKLRIKNEAHSQPVPISSPVNLNEPTQNNQHVERGGTINSNQMINQAVPWLQANSFAVAAALLGGLSFPANPNNILERNPQNNMNPLQVSSKPMDLSMEHGPPKPLSQKSNRSRSRQLPRNA